MGTTTIKFTEPSELHEGIVMASTQTKINTDVMVEEMDRLKKEYDNKNKKLFYLTIFIIIVAVAAVVLLWVSTITKNPSITLLSNSTNFFYLCMSIVYINNRIDVENLNGEIGIYNTIIYSILKGGE